MAVLSFNTTDEVAAGALHTPPSYPFASIVAAATKRLLQDTKISVSNRLHLLERLNSLTDWYFTAHMLSLIQPSSEIGCQMLSEERSLDPPDNKDSAASLRILTTPGVFAHFVALNPSLIAAIRWRAQTPRAPHSKEN